VATGQSPLPLLFHYFFQPNCSAFAAHLAAVAAHFAAFAAHLAAAAVAAHLAAFAAHLAAFAAHLAAVAAHLAAAKCAFFTESFFTSTGLSAIGHLHALICNVSIQYTK
jgi:hypothetical protein